MNRQRYSRVWAWVVSRWCCAKFATLQKSSQGVPHFNIIQHYGCELDPFSHFLIGNLENFAKLMGVNRVYRLIRFSHCYEFSTTPAGHHPHLNSHILLPIDPSFLTNSPCQTPTISSPRPHQCLKRLCYECKVAGWLRKVAGFLRCALGKGKKCKLWFLPNSEPLIRIMCDTYAQC